MSGEPTAVLAEFAASLTYEAIPERVRDYCKDLLLDALACAVAGHAGEETHQLAALSSALGQSRESTVIGGDRLSLAGATMLNGYLITAVTMCDAHRPTMTHITPEVVPPALAIAERDALSGRELLVALAAGFEVTTRIGIGVDFPEFRARGWHGPGIFGPFGAAAAVGRLLGFDTDTMARAFGLAELRIGAARGASSMIGLTLGTGVGGVIAVDGRVHEGHDGTAGEIGHQTIDPDAHSG